MEHLNDGAAFFSDGVGGVVGLLVLLAVGGYFAYKYRSKIKAKADELKK